MTFPIPKQTDWIHQNIFPSLIQKHRSAEPCVSSSKPLRKYCFLFPYCLASAITKKLLIKTKISTPNPHFFRAKLNQKDQNIFLLGKMELAKNIPEPLTPGLSLVQQIITASILWDTSDINGAEKEEVGNISWPGSKAKQSSLLICQICFYQQK